MGSSPRTTRFLLGDLLWAKAEASALLLAARVSIDLFGVRKEKEKGKRQTWRSESGKRVL